MLGAVNSIAIPPVLGLLGFLVLWIVLFEVTHLLVALLRRDRLIGWAIGPLGVSTMFVSEPPRLYIVLEALFPAAISGSILYFGLFTHWSPVSLPHNPLFIIAVLTVGVLVTSTGDFINALADLVYPLWGEARVLRHIQFLRASWATIHFTPFGQSYLRDHFDSTPTDLLQAF